MDAATDVVARRPVSFRFDELVIDCADPELLAGFWAAVLGYEIRECDEMMAGIEDPRGVHPSICFQKVADEKRAKNRVHFDLDVDEGTFEEAVSQLVALGAREIDVGQGEQRAWAVMADPEGNEFCVVA